MDDKQDLYFIDFDKLFENYADAYYRAHESEYADPEDFAGELDKVYHKWATSAQEVLGGISPSEFFNRIPTDELVEILKGSCVGKNNPNSLLFDRIATEPSLLGELKKLALSAKDEKTLEVTLSLIGEIGCDDSEFYIKMLSRDVDDHVKEMCVDVLCDRADEVKERLIELASNTDELSLKVLYVEPLSCCENGDERIVELIRSLAAGDGSEQNLAYVAQLAGRYGDDRACEFLYPMLDDCDYATFLEVRNAIEELGGTVDAHYRDFTDDPTYAAVKNNKPPRK